MQTQPFVVQAPVRARHLTCSQLRCFLTTMGRSFVQVDATEKRLTHNMKKAGLTWELMQQITERSSDTLNSVLKGKCPPSPKFVKKTTAMKGVAKDREHLKFRKADVTVKAKGVISKDDFLELVKAAKVLH